MLWLGEMLQKYPELAVFAALGIGYWIGSLRIAGFSFGGVTGSLLAGILVGWLFVVPVSAPAKSLVFLLFLFGVGYEVGPRFFTALKGDGWRFSVLGVFVPVIGLLVAWVVASYLRLDPGFSAGMMSGRADAITGDGHCKRGDFGAGHRRRPEGEIHRQCRYRRCALLRIRRAWRNHLLYGTRAAPAQARPAGGSPGARGEIRHAA